MIHRSTDVSVDDTPAICSRRMVVGRGVVVVVGGFAMLGAVVRVLADMAYIPKFPYQ